MKSIVELINELAEMTDSEVCERFGVGPQAAYGHRLDFDRWLRLASPREYERIEHAHSDYLRSFGR